MTFLDANFVDSFDCRRYLALFQNLFSIVKVGQIIHLSLKFFSVKNCITIMFS